MSKVLLFTFILIGVFINTYSKNVTRANTILSQNRAKAIANYFVTEGIRKTCLNAIGKGETELLSHCKNGVICSESENSVNRSTILEFYQIE